MKKFHINKQFNWRIILLRILVNAVALIVVAAVLPDVYFVQPAIIYALWLALFLGVLNAILKPVLQFLTFSLIFVSYGIVIIAIDTLLLYLLDFFFPSLFEITNLFWALVGGALLGILSSFLEDLVGIAPPIIPEKYIELRKAVAAGLAPSLEASVAASTGEILPSSPDTAKIDSAPEFGAETSASPASAATREAESNSSEEQNPTNLPESKA